MIFLPFGKKKSIEDFIKGIRKDTLATILEAAKSTHPKEFAAILRAEDKVISEILLLPGTLSGEQSALFKLHMLPVDFSVVGTAHSHPSPNFNPSGADLAFFQRFGFIHIIAAYPYYEGTWAAWDFYGNRIDLKVVE
ncbi:MAG: Mov34/MPN/PAD-1 family protein [Thermoplasmata archaeon]|nr:Mov34/MPN/PAD-1 family protein [Thermoplasmata archaeon]